MFHPARINSCSFLSNSYKSEEPQKKNGIPLFGAEGTSHGRGRIFGLLKVSGRLSSSRENGIPLFG